MGSGIVFVYLVIAALVAPVVWIAWWLAASAGAPELHPAPLALSAAPEAGGGRVAAHPFAVDLNLPSRQGSVNIYAQTGRQLGACQGPDAKGKCPRPDDSGFVPCSGCVLSLPLPVRGSFEWQIPAHYQSCLLGSYSIFRQAT